MWAHKATRVICDKNTGKIRAFLLDKQNVHIMMAQWDDVECINIEPMLVPKRDLPTHINLITLELY